MKILVIGNTNTGKTSICRRFAENTFTQGYRATVGVDMFVRNDMILWDIAGQERFGNITSVYYRGAMGAMVVFDWNAQGSLENALKWVKDLQEKADHTIPMLLVANKSDLPSVYSLEDIESSCKANNAIIGWIQCSAKTGHGVQDAVQRIVSCGIAIKEEENAIKLHMKMYEEEEEERDDCCSI